MKQILHIFRKDTRHFWPEILTVALFLVAAVLHLPIRWRPIGDAEHSRYLYNMVNVQIMLLPLIWWMLVARLIHGETLVGVNQFWLTRPYEWKKLLAAKMLFLLVWLGVPIFLAQCAALAEAGFHPLWYVPELVSSLVLVISLCVLPVVALATVTANFARLTLTLLGVFLAYLACMLVITQRTGYESIVPYNTYFIYPLILALFAGVTIVLQYSTRRVWLGRTLAASMFVLIGLAGVMIWSLQERGVTNAYASTKSSKPVQLAFAPNTTDHVTLNPSEREGQVYILVPVVFSGVAEGSIAEVDNAKFTVDTPDGYHWTAPWRTEDDRYPSGEHHSSVTIMMNQDLYERLKPTPFNLHLTLAVTRLQTSKVTTVEVAKRDFEVPGVGICSTRSFFSAPGLYCRFPLTDPPLTHVEAKWSIKPCSGPQPEANAAPQGEEWLGFINPTVGILPVQIQYSNLSQRTSDGKVVKNWRSLALCPGTPVTFTQYQPAERTQVELTIPNFTLPPIEQR